MTVEVLMPKMGESITEGTLIKWHKKVGDKIERDEIIFEISTDKVDTEIPSPENGILAEIKVQENETVEVDTVVALIETEKSADAKSVKSAPEENLKPVDPESIPTTAQVGGKVIEIPMPKMGESVMEGTIVKWLKNEGDKVERDEIIFEISTDKVDTEVPSPAEGVLFEIIAKENDTVEVGGTVAKLSTTTGVVQPKYDSPKVEAENEPHEADKISNNEKFDERGQKINSDRFYSPVVLNIARKESISLEDLEQIRGTGLRGRVTKKDILKYAANRGEKSSAPARDAEKSSPKIESKSGEAEIIPMDNVRQKIMQHMINSRDTSVHVTAMMEVDMSKIYNFIEANKSTFLQKEGVKLTYMPFICSSVISALKLYPLMNASVEGKNIVRKNFINLGIAVAVEPNGLIVPNIKNADHMSITGLAKAIADLSSKSRTKGLLPDDIMNGTFSITNYGVFGSLFGTPIINQPEVGILGVGAVTKKPVVITTGGVDTIGIKPMMYLSLSHDHRLVDGLLGGKFLKAVREKLEQFDVSGI